jgi:predicted nucleic acid-binding Zn ribbon protein
MWTRIKNIIPLVARRLNLERQSKEQQIYFLWSSVISRAYGDEYGDRFKPIQFRNKILFVACPNSVWVNELQMKSGELVGKINQEIGFPAVERIKFFC